MKKAESLFQLCNTLEMDLQMIDTFIVSENASSQEMTEVLVCLLDEHQYEIDSFQRANGRAPKPSELVLKNLPKLVELMLKRGLDPNFVFAKSNGFFDEYYNVMNYVKWIDNSPIQLQTMRVLLENGADPNLLIGDEHFFEALDADIVTDVDLFEIEDEDKPAFEKNFRLWLLLIAYGGRTEKLECAVNMKNGYTTEIFKNSENFAYRLELLPDDWMLHIFCTDTGETVAEL